MVSTRRTRAQGSPSPVRSVPSVTKRKSKAKVVDVVPWYKDRIPVGFVVFALGISMMFDSRAKWVLWMLCVGTAWWEVGSLFGLSKQSKKLNVTAQVFGNLFALFDFVLCLQWFNDEDYPVDPVLAYMFLRTMFVVSILWMTSAPLKDTVLYAYLLNTVTSATLIWCFMPAAAAIGCVIFIAASDAFQYFVGKQFGRTKIVPTISPNKSLEGYIGSVLLCNALTVVYVNDLTPEFYLFHNGLLLCGILGDLAVSSWKRFHAAKDTSDIFASHGGMLDRLDSHLGGFFYTIVYLRITHTQLAEFNPIDFDRLVYAATIVWGGIWVHWIKKRVFG